MGRHQGRESNRIVARRHAKYLVATASTVRAPLSESDADEYIQAIFHNQAAVFAICRLVIIDLDGVWIPSRFGTMFPITLLHFAAIMHKDLIVSALLRSGANPAITAVDCDSQNSYCWSSSAKKFLQSLPSAYSAWLVKQVVFMREKGRVADLKSCMKCSWMKSMSLDWSCVFHCGHGFCETCVWTHIQSDANATGTLPCPKCGVATSPMSELNEVRQMNISKISLEKWKQLPSTLEEAKTRGCLVPNPPFQALPLHVLWRLCLGSCQSERSTHLITAASTGATLRCFFLLEAGCDIDAVDEYGQTALFASIARGHRNTASLLLNCGANPLCALPTGVTPCDIATMNNNESILQLLHAFHQPDFNYQQNNKISVSILLSCLGNDVRRGKMTVLIPEALDHPGAGAFLIDDCFSDSFLCHLQSVCKSIPVAPPEKKCNSDRHFYLDVTAYVRRRLTAAYDVNVDQGNDSVTGNPEYLLEPRMNSTQIYRAFPNMRFLNYTFEGGSLAAHIDLSRTDDCGVSSTRTFILYLTTCDVGGETALLEHVASASSDKYRVLHVVHPRRGRLLVFPHKCPHEGRSTVQVPKLLLRGEFY